jgi:hypothetical protein
LRLSVSLGRAQDAKIPLERLTALEKAEETVEVALDERLMQLAAKFSTAKTLRQQSERSRRWLERHLRTRLHIEQAGEYDINESSHCVRSCAPRLAEDRRRPQQAWWRQVRRASVDQQRMTSPDWYIIAADPKELTLVNIIGMIDLEKLSQLQGQLGIPKFDFDFGGKSKPRMMKNRPLISTTLRARSERAVLC